MYPPGVVFYPNDKELVFDYLRKKVAGGIDDKSCFISTIELYKHKPSELKDLAHDSGHEKMYFFTLLKKFRNGENISRQVPGGFWKQTTSGTLVKGNDGNAIATNKPLTYWTKVQTEEGVERFEKTNWLMKEYKLIESQPSTNQDDDEESDMAYHWALCVVYRKKTVTH